MSTTDGTKITTPVGRIVWGHPQKQRPRTDVNGKPILKSDGTPAMQYIFGFAIPKAEFLATIWPAMQAEAAKGFPQGIPQNFAWKYDDGDDNRPVQGGGAPYSEREGYPGCYVITVASALDSAPPIFRFDVSTNQYVQMSAEEFKTGYYGCVALNISCNVPENRTHTPSLYLNPEGIEFVGYGKEIQGVGAVNPMQAFGGRPHQLPPGASATPISSAPAGIGMPRPQQPMQPAPMGQPGYPQQPIQPAPMGQPGYPQQPIQPAPMGQPGYPAPAHDFVQNAGMQQPMQPGYPAQPGMLPPR